MVTLGQNSGSLIRLTNKATDFYELKYPDIQAVTLFLCEGIYIVIREGSGADAECVLKSERQTSRQEEPDADSIIQD